MATTERLVRRGFLLVGSALPRARRTDLRLAPAVTQTGEEATAPDDGAPVSERRIGAAVDAPLGNIAGTAELLLDTPLGPLQQSYVRGILGWADEIRTGVDRLLGRSAPDPVPVDPGELIDTVTKLLAGPARDKGIGFSAQVETDVPQISADLPVLRQLLVRLSAEAIKRTERGSVALRVLRVTGGVRIVILDGAPEAEEPSEAVQQLAARLGAEIAVLHSGEGGAVSLTLPASACLFGRGGEAGVAGSGDPAGVEALMQRLSRELLARGP